MRSSGRPSPCSGAPSSPRSPPRPRRPSCGRPCCPGTSRTKLIPCKKNKQKNFNLISFFSIFLALRSSKPADTGEARDAERVERQQESVSRSPYAVHYTPHQVRFPPRTRAGSGASRQLRGFAFTFQVVAELEANDLTINGPAPAPAPGAVSGAVREVWQALDQAPARDRNGTRANAEVLDDFFWDIWLGQDDPGRVREARARMMRQYMDTSVDPCSDFYTYACGGWARSHPIPPDKTVFDTFETLREMLDAALRVELERPASDAASAKADATDKAKWLYQSCMNHALLEARGVAPLVDLLQSLGGWPVLDPTWAERNPDFDWLHLMAQLRLYNNDILIAEWVGPDVKNSDQYVIQLDQTGLGLPTRDYFLTASNAPYLKAYKEFMVEVMELLGAEPAAAAAHADEIVTFETSLAQIVASSEERRNVSQLYRQLSLRELCDTVPGVDWRRYLAVVLGRSVPDEEPVVIFALRYMSDLVGLVEKVPKRVVADYLLWRFVRHRVNSLGDRFGAAKQRLLHALMGREALPPRWKTCVAHVNSHMGMALGALFVRKYFDHNSKQDTLEMTRDITQSFREMLNETQWIDEETRRLAMHKVDSMQLRIGYPDFVLDREALNERYEDVEIHPDRYFENTLNILRKLARVEQERLGTPVNKTLWNTAPAVVNAYYSRNKNQIMFPAGILQPPFYHRHLPRSLNYGGIGVVIGHEITHGFDDKGRLFDQHGNLLRWWGEDAVNNFHQRAQCLIDQYSKYSVSEIDLLINGENTQGENIADNGGIKQAFRAYERWASQHGDAGETLPGVNATSKQLFFINFAQVWCSSMRPEAMRSKLKIAVHSPARFRVIGTLSNSREFAEVFRCPAGSPMNPGEKCSVW
ncbi:hypothetical protein ONE63_007013 [Megalurothrips usitatus]|uniref:Uncharacterized protein n=1 Tax=Megalurothrips usitatus TaxID=439358 RepID=A0AAV7XVK1_9NEOP|nr:hypothetical protein ONE63_007013 [Megalurothrips usitatus]